MSSCFKLILIEVQICSKRSTVIHPPPYFLFIMTYFPSSYLSPICHRWSWFYHCLQTFIVTSLSGFIRSLWYVSFFPLFFFFKGCEHSIRFDTELGVESQLQLLAYTTDTEMQDLRHICALCCSLPLYQILNPGRLGINPAASWIRAGFLTCWATMGTSILLFEGAIVPLAIHSNFSFVFFAATPVAYGSSRVGVKGAVHAILHHSSGKHTVLNPLIEAKEQTHVLMDTSRVSSQWAAMGTPIISCSFFFFTARRPLIISYNVSLGLMSRYQEGLTYLKNMATTYPNQTPHSAKAKRR